MNVNVDTYFTDGCGRCPLMSTPQCKVKTWEKELQQLRSIVVECGLTEESKWGVPVYTFQKSNIVLIAAFKENCVLSFFKGALLEDQNGILSLPGENTQSAKVIRFTNIGEIIKLTPILKAYIFEAIEVERIGLKVDFKKNLEPIPEEFQKKLDEIPTLKTAFQTLTQGRQRAYILYFSAPKQSKTREARIEKSIGQILKGKGLNE